MRRISIVFIALAATLVLTSGKPVKVACIGDSITFGYGMSMADWPVCNMPAVLNGKLGEGYEVRNFGFSARTLMNSGDRPYMKEKMYQDARDYQADVITIMLGTNDTKPENWTSADEFEQDLTAMVKELKAAKPRPKIYLCYPAWISKPTWGMSDSLVVNCIIPVIDKVARKNRLKVIDTHATLEGHPDKYIADGIHPGTAGAAMLAEDIYKAIRKK